MFNSNSLTYEPIIEPWDLKCHLKQTVSQGATKLVISSDQMLNFNLTYQSAKSLKLGLDMLDKMTHASTENEVFNEREEIIEENYVSGGDVGRYRDDP